MAAPTKIDPSSIISRIVSVRGQRVLFDSDLAEVYGVTTKRLNQQVNRNIERFPGDFIFPLEPLARRRTQAAPGTHRTWRDPVLPAALDDLLSGVASFKVIPGTSHNSISESSDYFPVLAGFH